LDHASPPHFTKEKGIYSYRKGRDEWRVHLLEKLNGERSPDESRAAQPKTFFGCSISGCDDAILVAKINMMID